MKDSSFVTKLGVAFQGLLYGISKEKNLKIQIFIGLMVIILSILAKIPKTHLIIIILTIFIVLILELINTGLESLIDIISPQMHDGFGKVKDIMAGVVLLSVILSIIIGILILYRPLVNLMTGQ